MSVAELAKAIGQTGFLQYPDGMRYAVKITDVKQAYGVIRFQVYPAGSTPDIKILVDSSRVQLDGQEAR